MLNISSITTLDKCYTYICLQRVSDMRGVYSKISLQNVQPHFCSALSAIISLVSVNGTPSSPIKPLTNDKILHQSKFKALTQDKINVTQKLKFVSGRIGRILGKGENAGYQQFLVFPKCFQKPSSSVSLKGGILCKG